MANIKSVSEIAGKWARVTPARAADYKAGVENPKRDWAEAASAAESVYKQAVIEAANAGRYGKGIERAGTAKWKHGATTKGPSRFAAGVALGKDAYMKGFAPYQEVIASTSLPARGPKGDPANLQRVAAIATALHERKISG